jgi:hypothetical protein
MPNKIRGVWTTAELQAAGLSSRQIGRLVRQGALCPLLTGVYATPAATAAVVGEVRDDRARKAGEHLLRVAAALKLDGSRPTRSARSTGSWRSAGSHQSAARVYRLGIVGNDPAPLIQITRAPGTRGSHTGRPEVRVHVAALPADHVVSYRGVLLTSVPRTVIDLARVLPFGEGVAVADSALSAGLTSKNELTAVIAGCERWRGLQRAREVTAFSDARSESVLESLSRAVFHRVGLPPPDLQVWIGDDGEIIGRVDFLWRRYRTIGEADGAFKYQTPARARAQLERDARLRAAGYEVAHFSWKEITLVPAQVVDAIQVAFSRPGGP